MKFLICVYTFFLLHISLLLDAQHRDLVKYHELTFHSNILNQDRNIVIYLPENYDKDRSYPVSYILDGEVLTFYSGSLMDRMAEASVIPSMIIIGIKNENRIKDFTPVHDKTLENSGGGTKFVDFIENELCSYIDSLYHTLPYRIFVGHSLGGLLVTHTLFSDNNMFNAYIVIDPSLWVADHYLIKKVAAVKNVDFENKRVYVTSVIKSTDSIGTNNGHGIQTLQKTLNDKTNIGLEYKFENFESENHGSVSPISIMKGFKYIFQNYQYEIENTGAIEIRLNNISKHYTNYSIAVGATFLPPEGQLNDLGYIALKEFQEYEMAIKIFKISTTNYPTSSNCWDSLGEAYYDKGDKANAVKNYQECLKLKPESINARLMIEKMK